MSSKISSFNLSKIFFFLFILSLFFPIRYVFFNESSVSTGIYSDFTSISLYLSDILLFLSFIFIVPRGKCLFWSSIKDKGLGIFIIWLILALFWQIHIGFSDLNVFFFLKMAELIVLYGTTAILFNKFSLKKPFLAIFSILAAIQSIIALAQFYLQHPIGLYKLGEHVVLPEIIGVAKLFVEGTTYIRGYGTFPHPNPLSAFLVVGILATLYLLIQKTRRRERVLYGVFLFLNVLGLTVTFSRAAFLALFIGLLLFFSSILIFSRRMSADSKEDDPPKPLAKEGGYLMFNAKQKNAPSQEDVEGQGRGRYFMVIVMVIVSLLASFFIFKPYLLTRATVSDNAALERMEYNQIGIRIVKDNPIFGVGGGESVLHMEQYSNTKLWPWQKQPIHNYFLLTAAELGIIGAIILIWIFLSHLKSLILNLKFSTYYLLLTTIFLCFLILMLFDHYFYTLQQPQMLLWLTLGLIAAEKTNSPPYEGGERGGFSL